MNRLLRLTSTGVLTLAIALGIGCANTNDANTADRVEKALEEANLKDVNVDYDQNANVVHLKGKVNSAGERQQAEQIAETAVGTTGKVLNELTVEGMNEDRIESADDQIKNRLNDAVNANAQLSEQSIDFYVNNGVVTITGEVANQAQKEQVGQLVKGTPGVKDFANELTIEKSSNRPRR